MRGFTGHGTAPDVMRSMMPFNSRAREQARTSDEVRSSEARGRTMSEPGKSSTTSTETKPVTPSTEAAKPAAPRKPEKPQ